MLAEKTIPGYGKITNGWTNYHHKLRITNFLKKIPFEQLSLVDDAFSGGMKGSLVTIVSGGQVFGAERIHQRCLLNGA